MRLEYEDLPPKYRKQVDLQKMQANKKEFEAIKAKKEKKQEQPKKSKYGNKKVTVDGITFDSVRESKRYIYLKDRLDRGLISDLKLQEEFVLQNAFKDLNGNRIQAIKYIADFTYRDPFHFGKLVVEDSKGAKTKEYLMKRKMFVERFGFEIQEV